MPGHEEYCSRVKDLLGFDLLGVLGKSSLRQLTGFLRHLRSADLLTWEMFRTICTMLGNAKETWVLLPEGERKSFTDAIWATARDGVEYESWIYAVSLMTMKNTLTAFQKDPGIYARMDEVKAIVDSETLRLGRRYDPDTCARLLDAFFAGPDCANRAITRVSVRRLADALSDLPPPLWAPRIGTVISANARDELRSLLTDPRFRPDAFRKADGKDALFRAFFARCAKDDKPDLAGACGQLFSLPDRAFAECVEAFGPVVLANLLKEDRACLRSWAAESGRLPRAFGVVIGGVMEFNFRIKKIDAENEVRRLAETTAVQRVRSSC